MSILSYTYDPFADEKEDLTDDTIPVWENYKLMESIVSKMVIHIRKQQRTTRKSFTNIEGFDERLNMNKILGAFKSELKCNGSIQDGTVIQLQGDHTQDVKTMLIDMGLVQKENVHVHSV